MRNLIKIAGLLALCLSLSAVATSCGNDEPDVPIVKPDVPDEPIVDPDKPDEPDEPVVNPDDLDGPDGPVVQGKLPGTKWKGEFYGMSLVLEFRQNGILVEECDGDICNVN